MKRLIFIFVLSLMCVEIAFANDLFISVSGISQVKKSKMRTFSMGGKTVTVNIEETVKDYFQESLQLRQHFAKIVLKYGFLRNQINIEYMPVYAYLYAY